MISRTSLRCCLRACRAFKPPGPEPSTGAQSISCQLRPPGSLLTPAATCRARAMRMAGGCGGMSQHPAYTARAYHSLTHRAHHVSCGQTWLGRTLLNPCQQLHSAAASCSVAHIWQPTREARRQLIAASAMLEELINPTTVNIVSQYLVAVACAARSPCLAAFAGIPCSRCHGTRHLLAPLC
jgi:hypothetical protein